MNRKSSSWSDVTSEVSQGTVPGEGLFLVYINDIDEKLSCIISNLADDTEIAETVLTNAQSVEIQSNLDGLANWVHT